MSKYRVLDIKPPITLNNTDRRGPPTPPLRTALFGHQYSIYWCCTSLLC